MSAVVFTCHPKLLGKLRLGGPWFQANLERKKMFMRPHLNKKKAGCGDAYLSIPAMVGSEK
jgi:hypothetical protein